MKYTTFAGIDISAKKAHVALITSDGEVHKPFVIAQTPAGMDHLKQTLLSVESAPGQTLVVMEVTGVYWMKLATYLYESGFSVSVINPAQAHDFASAFLHRNKTDAIDAKILAELALKVQPDCWKPSSETYELVYQRLTQRDDLLQMLQQTRNRLHALIHRPFVVASVQQHFEQLIAFLQAQIDDLDRELKQALSQDDQWNQSAQLLLSIKGFGPVVTTWLLTATDNFSACERPEQIVSYAGLAPRKKDSGSSIRSRPFIGFAPHPRLRQALYMASLSAVQHNPAIKSFYQRLLDKGKPKKVALCACARKLVHIAWAVIAKQQLFDPEFHLYNEFEAFDDLVPA
jgi:transposase